MKRIAIAGFSHETNTFSPLKTTFEDFAGQGSVMSGKLDSDDLFRLGQGQYNSAVSGFYNGSQHFDFELVPLVSYSAGPSGAVPLEVFNRIMDDIVLQVESTSTDGIFLDLHGAMVVEGFLDGETEILKRLRNIIGSLPIVASLDLHGNIAPESMELCSAFISCREYPHIDMFETGERCAVTMGHLLNGDSMDYAFHQLPFLLTSSKETTFRDPSKSLYARIAEVEAWDGVYSASIMQGFAGADVEHMGPSVFAYAATQAGADRAARYLLDEFMAIEAEFTPAGYAVEDGVRQSIHWAAQAPKPVVIADIQDNPGGGSSSDTMFLLKELQRQDARGAVIGMIYDPQSAAAAHAAGVGAEIRLDLGGKYIAGDTPLQAIYQVEKLHSGAVTGTGPMAKGMQFDLGKMALLRLDDILIVVGSQRLQAADQSLFTVLGVNPAKMKIVALKSANHFRADFEPIASKVISVIAPGTDVEDPATFTYHNLRSGVRLHGNGPIQDR